MKNYTFEVAYINSLVPHKIIPYSSLQDIISSHKSIPQIIQILKDYKYPKISGIAEQDLYNASKFEDVLLSELEETFNLLDGLVHNEHKWVLNFLWDYFVESKFSNIEDLVGYLESIEKNFKTLNSDLLKKLYSLVVDFENIKLFLSYTLLENLSAKDTKFIRFGNLDVLLLKNLFPLVENLNHYLENTYYPQLKLTLQVAKEDINYYFQYYLKELIWQSKFYYFTIEPIVFYFLEKLIESQKLKEIYYDIKFS